jgi:serine protein kinase
MKNSDFRQLILDQRKDKGTDLWEGSCLDYLYKVKENPLIAQLAPGRVYDMLMDPGTEDVDENLKIKNYDDLVLYNSFKDSIFGTLEPIHDIMRFLKASARRTETGKRILILVGPVSSGKSTIASLIKKGLENYDVPKFAIKGCPIHEEPLHLIPESDRPFWEKELGIKIEGTLCPVCQLEREELRGDDGSVKWEDTPVTQIKFSEQKRIGIGTFQPSDPKSQDISELIGRVNMSKMTRYGETDPRAYQFNGELQIANGGLIEYIEILKADVKFHYVLITAAQEQVIKSPGFPQMYVDTLILAHTNQTEFDTFKADKKNEALHDRMYPIYVPWNLRVDDEIRIYEKMIAESDFTGIHIAPNTLKLCAQFAVLSRLVPSTKVSSLIDKMKIYNGEITESMRKEDVDVKAMRTEGRAAGEGMSGISPRFIINALNIALGMKENKKCINPIDVIRALVANFDHSIGISDEDKTRFLGMLTSGKDSVTSEYKIIAQKEVNKAFLEAYDTQAQTLFDNYIMNAESFCKKEKVIDPITDEYSEPDEKLMRQIEEYIGVPVNSKAEFRNGIFVYKSSQLEKGLPFTFNDYDPLKDAVEKKLVSDLKNVVALTIADKTVDSEKKRKKRSDAIDKLKAQGYCDECASVLLAFVGKILRQES